MIDFWKVDKVVNLMSTSFCQTLIADSVPIPFFTAVRCRKQASKHDFGPLEGPLCQHLVKIAPEEAGIGLGRTKREEARLRTIVLQRLVEAFHLALEQLQGVGSLVQFVMLADAFQAVRGVDDALGTEI